MTERLADIRCSEVEDADVPLLATITQLSEATVRRRLRSTHGNVLVVNAFADEWPIDHDALAPLTVASARNAVLDEEIAAATGLGVRAVRNHLEREHGKTLLSNAFPELAEDDEDDEDDEEEEDEDEDDEDEGDEEDDGSPAGWTRFADGRKKFSTLELIESLPAVAVRRSDDFIGWIASVIGMTKSAATRRLRSVHGRTMLKTVFDGRWPPRRLGDIPRESIGSTRCSRVRRSPPFIRLVADLAGVAPKDTYDRLRDAPGNARVDTVFPELVEAPTASDRPKKRQTDSEPPPASSRPERLIGGRYRLGKQLGAGGFGRVFEATYVQPPHERVVIKLELPDAPESLKNEIGAAFQLSHQNICAYKDYGDDARMGTFLVLQHGGRALESILMEQGPLDVDRAVDVLAQVAAGLDYAHKHGVIHQDIKPGNILVADVDDGWEVRVTDFGIALKGIAAKNTIGKHTVLATHPVGYTRAYAAPEQLAGGKGRKASDQYSLALVFCSMLEGEVFSKPYEPRRFRRLSAAQNAALQKALSEDADDRFESCGAFARELGR